jgi:hypothetical protein
LTTIPIEEIDVEEEVEVEFVKEEEVGDQSPDLWW